MPLPVILISSNSFEESVGSSTTWVILFGMIHAVIPTNVSTTVPAVLEMVRLLSLCLLGIKVVLCSSSSSSSAFTPPAPCQIVPTLRDLPCRFSILVLPDQEIPFDRPFRTHPNRARMLLTLRMRVHPFPSSILANYRRFYSSSPSSPRKRRRVSPYSSSSATHSSSSMSAGPSRKRCRSHTADSLLIRADLLPPHKSIETGAEGDIKRDIKVSYEADTDSYIDSDILADIEADIVTKAATTIEADFAADTVVAVKTDVEPVEEGSEPVEAEVDVELSAKDTVEIAVDVVVDVGNYMI
nr:hypothetical protein [Tanacetum cinerariifolium]